MKFIDRARVLQYKWPALHSWIWYCREMMFPNWRTVEDFADLHYDSIPL